jgi:hypothetical protein
VGLGVFKTSYIYIYLYFRVKSIYCVEYFFLIPRRPPQDRLVVRLIGASYRIAIKYIARKAKVSPLKPFKGDD